MELIDRRGFARVILVGAAVLPRVWPRAPERQLPCRSTTASRAPSTTGSRRLRRSSSPRVRVAVLGAASDVAGGREAAASAAGAGSSLTDQYCV